MIKRKLITQTYVSIEENNVFIIKYYVFFEQSTALYGLCIEQTGAESSVCQSKAFMSDRDAAVNLAHLYAENFVFPVSLNDLVEDLEYDRGL